MLKLIKNFFIFNFIYFTISFIFFIISFAFIYYFLELSKVQKSSFLIENEFNYIQQNELIELQVLFEKSNELYNGKLEKIIEAEAKKTFSDNQIFKVIKNNFFKKNKYDNSQQISYSYSDLGYALRTYIECSDENICEDFADYFYDNIEKIIKENIIQLLEKLNSYTIEELNIMINDIKYKINTNDNKLKNYKENNFNDKDINLNLKSYFDYYFEHPNLKSNIYSLNQEMTKLKSDIYFFNFYKKIFIDKLQKSKILIILKQYKSSSSSNSLLFIFLISFLLSTILYGSLVNYKNK